MDLVKNLDFFAMTNAPLGTHVLVLTASRTAFKDGETMDSSVDLRSTEEGLDIPIGHLIGSKLRLESADVKLTTESETVSGGERSFTQNADLDSTLLDAAFAGHQLPTAILWDSMVVLIFPVRKSLLLAHLTPLVALLTKKTMPDFATRNAELDTTGLVLSAGPPLLKIG